MKACLAALLLLFVPLLQAHDARPLALTLVEQAGSLYRVVLRAPPTLPASNAPTLLWPAQCEILETAPLTMALGASMLVQCPGGLRGQSLQLRYPDTNPSLTTLLRLENLDGSSITQVLPPDRLRWQIPDSPGFGALARQYTLLGFEHILEGADHLLFVAGLLLLARRTRRILLAVTGFTLAHSLTLALATFGLVRLPVPLVETLIALSVVFLAVEIAHQDPRSLGMRYPVLLSFGFGLLHGFGFASALNEISLPLGDVLSGLLFFNIGVELGQLVFIGVCLLLWQPCWRWWQGQAGTLELPVTRLLRAGSYLLGIPAAYWTVERALGLFLA